MPIMTLRMQRGVSLIEVLVALVVLGLGFVGYAALQLLGVRTNNESLYRTQAVMLAESMAERMHANRRAANDPAVNGGNSLYDGLDSAAIDCGVSPLRCDRMAGGVDPGDCTPAQVVTWDAYSVFCGLPSGGDTRSGGIQNLLPEGTLAVDCVPVGGACDPTSSYDIVVTWEETETDRDPDSDQDDDGDTEFATRTVRLQVVP